MLITALSYHNKYCIGTCITQMCIHITKKMKRNNFALPFEYYDFLDM